MVHKVELMKAHLEKALLVCAREQPKTTVRCRAVREMYAHIQHLFWHPEIEEVSQTIRVPAELGIDATRYIHVGVDHAAIFLAITDTNVIAD